MAEKTREDQLLAEIAQLKEKIKVLEEQQGGAAGWLITTPASSFSGQTMNIQFRRGMAFIPDGAGGEQIASQMKAEFGYDVQHVENYLQLPDTSPVRRSMIDMLMIPEQR